MQLEILQRGDMRGGEPVSCNLCGRPGQSTYCWKEVGDCDLALQFTECLECHLIYLNPRPSHESLRKLFSSERYFRGKDKSLGYFDYLGEEVFRKKTAGIKLDKIESLLARKGRLLEIGCAAGFFLSVAKERGWDVLGVDVSEPMARHAQEKYQIDVIAEPFENLQLGQYPNLHERSFDVILCWGTLGTFPDPLGSFRVINKLLKDDGIFVFNASNTDSLTARLLGSKWFLLGPSALHVYNRQCLQRLMDRSGFVPLFMKRSLEYFTLNKILTKLSMVLGDLFSQAANKLAGFQPMHWLIQMPTFGMLEVYARKESSQC